MALIFNQKDPDFPRSFLSFLRFFAFLFADFRFYFDFWDLLTWFLSDFSESIFLDFVVASE